MGLGIGGGTVATSGGSPGGGAAFDTDYDTEANIRASVGAVVGTVAFGTDTDDLYVFDGLNWRIFNND